MIESVIAAARKALPTLDDKENTIVPEKKLNKLKIYKNE